MKKKSVIALVVALIMCFMMTACGGNSTNEIVLNETKTTDKFEVVLTQVEFAKSLNDSGGVSKDYLLPTEESSYIEASTGNTLLMFSIDLKYTGKEQFSASIGEFTVNYGEDYTFDDQEIYITERDNVAPWENTYSKVEGTAETYFVDFEPLEGERLLRGYVEVPEVAETEESEALSLTVNILGETFTYIIR